MELDNYVATKNKISSKNSLLSVIEKIEHANGLPNEYYISDKLFESEKHTVIFNNWSGLAFGKDIPHVGDIRPVNFLGLPLLIVRTEKNKINVFENTCRHRGMILLQEDQHFRKNIRCPYHNWCYGLDGSLESTPHVGGIGVHKHKDIKPDLLGLNQIRSYLWKDIIFINISGAAQNFKDNFSKLITRWEDFEKPVIFGGDDSSFSLTLKANWKLAVENYCESYHLPSVHPDLNKTSKLEDHYDICESPKYSGQGSYKYRQLSDDEGNVFPDFEDLSEKWDQGTEYVAIYPNVLMGVHRDLIFSVILNPISVEETTERVAFYYSSVLPSNKKINALKASNHLFWRDVLEEDVFVVEGMQKGRYSNMFDGGKFSPTMDQPTHNFHVWFAKQVLQNDTDTKEQSK
ncbi:MAG TPA: aromatic ring-hydroxylating dioxygenase subunit alpha [Woeseiaceae bacterium]|nr:aromatic ring-hydroxylating dioxygenase subunit alpha [Woeseiaceae bacterium]